MSRNLRSIGAVAGVFAVFLALFIVLVILPALYLGGTKGLPE
jgi:predicted RND superfamily exporter protein